MKQGIVFAGIAAVLVGLTSVASAKERTFGEDVAFLKKHVDVVVLEDGESRVAVVPAYQGRVMTSTTGGDDGPSYGFLKYDVIEQGLLPEAKRKGTLQEHIYVFGGEERFWLGPEGGQYAIFFKPGSKFEFTDWFTPPAIDTESYSLKKRSKKKAVFEYACELENWSGTPFKVEVDRTVRLLKGRAVKQIVGKLPEGVSCVAYETDNAIENAGDAAWTKESGMLSIWLLGMFKPGANTTVVIPFKGGDEAALGPKVNDTYFGKVPSEYLKVKDDVLFFKGDGTRRGKIGISPQRSKGIAGSYDADSMTLTLVTYNQPKQYVGYVNSMWEQQKEPFKGDAINSYNDGAPTPGAKPLGPFYELETSSPAAALKPGQSLKHVQRTLHIQGPEALLDPIAKRTLGVSLAEIKSAL